MPSRLDLQFVAYTPLGAQIITPWQQMPTLSATVNTPWSDAAAFTAQVSEIVASQVPDLLEIAVQYFDADTVTWIEPPNCRFMINGSQVDDTDPALVDSITGMQLWLWFAQKAYLNHVPAVTANGWNSESDLTLTSVTSSGSTFTKNSHGLNVGDIVVLDVTGGITTLKKAGAYFVTAKTTNTFQVSTTSTSAARALGTHTGIQVTRAHVKVTRSSNPFVDGEKVTVVHAGGSTTVTAGQDYYVVRANSTSLALSSTLNGPNIRLGTVSAMSLTAALDGMRRFSAQTPGAVLKTAIDEAQARGALGVISGTPQLTYDFTATTDSAGIAWAATYTCSFTPGTTVLALLQSLVANGWVEFSTDGRVLHAYNTGHGTDRSATMQIGSRAAARPIQKSLDNILTTITTVSSDGKKIGGTDQVGGVTTLGVLESYQTQAGVSDDGTSAAIVANALVAAKRPKQQYSVTELADVATYLPWRDYAAPDVIAVPLNGALVAFSISELQLRWDGQHTEVDIILGDRFQNFTGKLYHFLGRINGKVIDSGTGNQTTIPFINSTQPVAPANLAVTSNGAFAGQGLAKAGLAVSWDAVATTTDGDEVSVTDYEVFLRADGSETPVSQGKTGGSLSYTVGEVDANTVLAVSVRGINAAGATGPISDELEVTSSAPVVTLDTPSSPVVSSSSATLTIVWDGNLIDSTGAPVAPPAQFAYVVARISDTEFGTYEDVAQDLSAAGSLVYAHGVVGNTYWVQLYAIDNLGNESDASTAVSVVYAGVTGGDTGSDLTNLAFDGTFDDPLGVWMPTWPYILGQGWSIATDHYVSPPQALKLTMPNRVDIPWTGFNLTAAQIGSKFPVIPGDVVYVDWKAYQNSGSTKDSHFVGIEYYDLSDTLVGGEQILPSGTPNATWTALSGASDPAPAGSAYGFVVAGAQVIPNVGQSGWSLWFDDVVVRRSTTNNSIDASKALVPASVTSSELAPGSVDPTKLDATIPPQLTPVFASDSLRDAAIPSPVQGLECRRTDTGWTERYYSVYNAITNPGGAFVAGWWPVSGVLPILQVNGTANEAHTSTPQVVTGWPNTDYRRVLPALSSGVFTVPLVASGGLPGRYKISGWILFGGSAIAGYIAAMKNGTTILSANTDGSSSSIGNSLSVEAETVLSVGDTLSLFAGRTSGNITTRRLSIMYLGPA